MKIDIISGFLGSGKTTFIKRLLNSKLKNEKVVLIENEFGEISVDTDFLADTNIDVKELSQGCICCSLFGDFSKSLNEVVEKYNPDRILIEPSGVGKLSDIINAVKDANLSNCLNSLVCMVDVNKARMYSKNFGEFFLDQIKSAHTIILSRTDIASSTRVEEAIEIIRSYNKEALLVTTPIKELNDEELFNAYDGVIEYTLDDLLNEANEHHCCGHHHHADEECGCGHHHHADEECGCGHHHHDDEECGCGHHHHADEECGCGHHHHDDEECGCGHHHHDDEECGCGHHHHDDEECGCGHHHHADEECGCGHHHHADEVFNSIGFETAKRYDLESVKKALDDMANGKYGMIVRAKGVLCDNDGKWFEFNLTVAEVSINACNPRPIGKICVIGSHIDKNIIKELF